MARPHIIPVIPEGAPLLIKLSKADQVIGLSTATVSRLIRAGELERIKVGRAAFVPLDSILEFVARRKAQAAAGRRA
jgi:hypothetical protein